MQIPAGLFKAQCLKLMEDVQKFHTQIIVTKHGKPVARMVPMEPSLETPLFGFLKGSVEIKGDIIAPTGEAWHADV